MSFLQRIAAAQVDVEGGGPSDAQLGAMGVAAVSPFAGMLGQQPIIHDPLQGAEGKNFKSMRHLQRAARPGDVILTSKPKGSFFKNFIAPAGGSQFYHAQPVTGREYGRGYTFSAGDYFGPEYSRSNLHEYEPTIAEYLRGQDTGYTDAVLLRPKTPLTPEQLKALRESHLDRGFRDYDGVKAVSTWLRELFVPKWDFLNKGRPETVCEGNVCSTMPAQSYHEVGGPSVVPGKRAQDVFPTDFLRSKNFDLVGSKTTEGTRRLQRGAWGKAAPWVMRGGLGAGLAGTTYALSEDPALAGGALGGAYTGMMLNGTSLPPTLEVLQKGLDKELNTPEGRRMALKYFGGRVPLLALGAGAGYGGAKLLGKGVDRGIEALKERFSE